MGQGAPEHINSLLNIIENDKELFSRVKVANFISGRRWNLIFDDVLNGITVKLPEEDVADAWKKLVKLDKGMKYIADKYRKIDEIPFDFNRRRLSIAVTDGNKEQLITKGAVEEILKICTMVDYKGELSPISDEITQNILNISKKLNENGMRVVAVCQKNDIKDKTSFSVSDENNMILLGFIGFLDPPKESAYNSIKRLNDAGIRVIVLTR